MTIWFVRMTALVLWLMASSAVQAEQYAVLVGVENYQHASLRTPPLKYSVDDAADLAAFLREHGYQVTLLTDDEGRDPKMLPTRANIDRELQAVLRKAQADDTVVLTFSGHGLQFAGQQDAYFCPSDARPFADEAATLVSISAIYRELEKSFAGVKVILVDACRNDPDPSRGRGLDADSAPPPPKGVGALFSCSRGQKAYENDELKHGVFFHHILDGLRGAAVDDAGEVTFEGLSLHVRKRVPATMARLIPGVKQSPNFKADLEGIPPVLVRAGNKPALLLAPFTAAQAKAAQTAWAQHLVKPVVEKNGLGMELTLIPPGEFLMGLSAADVQAALAADSAAKAEYFADQQPQHRVRITKPFRMGTHEVTQGEYELVMGNNPSHFSKTGDGKAKLGGLDAKRFPVETVSWYDAVDFCNKLSSREGLKPYYTITNPKRGKDGSIESADVTILGGNGYRLPTEAEWEYAGRAGTSTAFHFGDVNNGKDANIDGNYPYGTTTKGTYLERTTTVGSYGANGFGLRDIHGNVWEWCGDWYAKDYYGQSTGTTVDPFGPSSGDYRVQRGGSWGGSARDARSAYRFNGTPDFRNDDVGFRVSRTP